MSRDCGSARSNYGDGLTDSLANKFAYFAIRSRALGANLIEGHSIIPGTLRGRHSEQIFQVVTQTDTSTDFNRRLPRAAFCLCCTVLRQTRLDSVKTGNSDGNRASCSLNQIF